MDALVFMSEDVPTKLFEVEQAEGMFIELIFQIKNHYSFAVIILIEKIYCNL